MFIKTEQLVYNHQTYKNPMTKHFPVHCHRMYELIFFERGEANYVIDERKYRLRKNDLVLARPFKYHYIEVTGECEYSRMNIIFSNQIVSDALLDSIPKELDVINCTSESILHGIFERINYYSTKLDEEDFSSILKAMLTEVVYNLRLVDIDAVHIPKTLPPILVRSLEYINENLFSVKDIKSICKLVNVSEQYLFRLFQNQLHISPHKYITTKRLLHAQTLLKQGHRPTDIYQRIGFDSYVSFYKQYKKVFGCPPSSDSENF